MSKDRIYSIIPSIWLISRRHIPRGVFGFDVPCIVDIVWLDFVMMISRRLQLMSIFVVSIVPSWPREIHRGLTGDAQETHRRPRERSEKTRRTIREHSENTQGNLTEHSQNIHHKVLKTEDSQRTRKGLTTEDSQISLKGLTEDSYRRLTIGNFQKTKRTCLLQQPGRP